MNNKLDYIAIDFETANQYRNSAYSVGLVRFEISYTDGAMRNSSMSLEAIGKLNGKLCSCINFRYTI